MSAHQDAYGLAARLHAPDGWLLWGTEDGAIYVHRPDDHDRRSFYIRRPWLKAHGFDAKVVQAEVEKRAARVEAR